MPLHKSKADANGGWAVWQVTETAEELWHLLPTEGLYAKELKLFTGAPKRLLERLAVRVLLYTCLGKEYEIVYTPNGKPYLASGRWHISISHTSGFVAVCWHSERITGIDIERSGGKALRLITRFISPADERLDTDYPQESALLYWSAKETLYKMLSRQEATDFVEHLHVEPFKVQKEGVLLGYDHRNPRPLYDLEYLLEADFALVWCFAIP